MAKIHRIVLTGGPCGGKTTLLSRATSVFKSLGFRFFCVPEASSILLGTGLHFPSMTPEANWEFQNSLYKLQTLLEDSTYKQAELTNQPCVILIDRGVLDTKGFVSQEMWTRLLENWNTTDASLHGRYDLVLHLVTAANGADSYYTTDNNPNRTETPQQALSVDQLLLQAWMGHPNRQILHNDVHFNSKLVRALNHIAHLTESALVREHATTYKLQLDPANFLQTSKTYVAEIKSLLNTSTQSEYLIKRTHSSRMTYIHKTLLAFNNPPVEKERLLSHDNYVSLCFHAIHQSEPSEAIVTPFETKTDSYDLIFVPATQEVLLRCWNNAPLPSEYSSRVAQENVSNLITYCC
jgi:predicted ATPase